MTQQLVNVPNANKVSNQIPMVFVFLLSPIVKFIINKLKILFSLVKNVWKIISQTKRVMLQLVTQKLPIVNPKKEDNVQPVWMVSQLFKLVIPYVFARPQFLTVLNIQMDFVLNVIQVLHINLTKKLTVWFVKILAQETQIANVLVVKTKHGFYSKNLISVLNLMQLPQIVLNITLITNNVNNATMDLKFAKN